jgi:hypothetical protein
MRRLLQNKCCPDYENYYLPGCPANGVSAHAFEKITFKNVYPSIDWVIYIKDNKLEHEFVVGAEGDASSIKLKYNGQDKMGINKDGSLTVSTPIGKVIENAPVSYNSNGKIPSSYQLNGAVLSYAVSAKGSMVIDPGLVWATYYGPIHWLPISIRARVIVWGTFMQVALPGAQVVSATTGTYQTVYGGNCDGFLVKFDTSGNRLWATYYGGTGGDWGVGVACDRFGYVYLTGVTRGSLTGIATTGCQQAVYGGGLEDGFLVKFTPFGARLWGTYLGGTGAEIPGSVTCGTHLIMCMWEDLQQAAVPTLQLQAVFCQ